MNLTDVFFMSKPLMERLFECVSSYDIFCSSLRRCRGSYLKPYIRKDNHPTFILFVPEDKDEVYFKDFAWQGGNVFKFVKLFRPVSRKALT
jgi:hypothetical protein